MPFAANTIPPPETAAPGGVAEDERIRLLAAALEATVSAVAITTRDGRIVWVNQAFTSLTGYAFAEVAGETFRILRSGENSPELYRDLWNTVLRGQPWRGELTNRRKNGVLYQEAMTVTPVEDSAGLVRHFVAVKEDITDRKNAESALRLAKLALDRSPNLVLMYSRDGSVVYANLQACHALGYSLQEMLSKTIWDCNPDFPRSRLDSTWENVRGSRRLPIRTRHRRSDGTTFPAELSAIYAEFAGHEYMFAVSHDISLRTAAEAAVAEQKHLLDVVMENLPDHIYFKDAASRFIRISRAQARWLGLDDPADAIGRSDFDFFSDEHAQAAFRAEQEIMRTGAPVIDVVEKETWADGRESWVSTTKMPLMDPSGAIRGTFGVSRDITRRKKDQEALRASEEFRRSIIESSHDGICVLDITGKTVYMSPAASALLGQAAEESTRRDLFSLFEEPGLKAAREAWELARNGGRGTFDANVRIDGQARTWDFVLSPITDASGAVEQLVCSFRDITDRRALESRLAQAEKLESIGQLAAGIAHEINTPVQYIGDNARFLADSFRELDQLLAVCQSAARGELAADGVAATFAGLAERLDLAYLRAEIPQAIEQSVQGLEHVAGIVRAMKEFSHQGAAEKTPTNLNDSIDTALTVSRNEWKYFADVVRDYDPGLPLVTCLRREFNQVILNLLINAAHAIAEANAGKAELKGTITVSTRQLGEDVEVRIRDTGTGIPEAIRSRVFDPFFTTKPVGKGTGQGLSIAHDVVVRKHGGSLSFETETGVGSTFIVRIPIHAKE